MIKKIVVLLAGILLIYCSVRSENGIHITSIELLTTGYDRSSGKIELSNYMLNICTMIIYISVIDRAISSTFKLRNYIFTRGGHKKLVMSLMKTAFQAILAILIVKQIIYLIFFAISTSFTQFYVYDMLSTLLTLSIIALVLIVTKLNGMREKLSFFLILCITIISQYMSYTYPFFSIVIIASAAWEGMKFWMIIYKSLIILTFSYIVIMLWTPDQLMGGVEE
ncbi:hypothetical protein [Bacillus sp. CECT 9360]|uniref:hypothetical protein n=1 Tax=Bacillus sp. CECT 9360 TaxID=2845821 RepID=UPI001E34DDAD|nr:hypothetical protein [Bacillus sp. CECT 9360]CAH0344395.1 hypothetical protein BCI9360_00648 [Bacillus sp. CECT 9360]